MKEQEQALLDALKTNKAHNDAHKMIGEALKNLTIVCDDLQKRFVRSRKRFNLLHEAYLLTQEAVADMAKHVKLPGWQREDPKIKTHTCPNCKVLVGFQCETCSWSPSDDLEAKP